MFDLGTKSKISPLCGLARGNPQWSGVLGLFSKFKISGFNFLMDLKVQSTTSEKIAQFGCLQNF